MTARKPGIATTAASVATFGSGVINLVSLMSPALPQRAAILKSVFPLEFLAISRFATLVVGFALIVSSLNVYKRKRRAFLVVCVLSVASTSTTPGSLKKAPRRRRRS